MNADIRMDALYCSDGLGAVERDGFEDRDAARPAIGQYIRGRRQLRRRCGCTVWCRAPAIGDPAQSLVPQTAVYPRRYRFRCPMLNDDGYRSDVALAPCGQHRRGFSRMEGRKHDGIGTTRRNRYTIGHNRLWRDVGRGCGTARFGLQVRKYAAL